MKALRAIVICALTVAVLLAICAPSLLQGVLPQAVIEAAAMDEFPLLGTCSRIASQLISAIRGKETVSLDIVTHAIGPNFMDELLSLLMVAVLSIPVSLLLGFLLYKPLYKGMLVKGLLYISLNLVSVLIAWILYRQLYFRLLIENLIQQHITDETVQTVVNYATQLASAALLGAAAIKIALGLLAARVMLNKIILPIIGTLIRTLLFAFLMALLLLLQATPQDWTVIVPLMLVTLIVSGLSDGMFGS